MLSSLVVKPPSSCIPTYEGYNKYWSHNPYVVAYKEPTKAHDQQKEIGRVEIKRF